MTTHADLLAALTGALLHGAPALPGALCRGRGRDFDWDRDGEAEDPEDRTARLDAAAGECRGCPALAPCGAWLASLTPGRRPSGAVAGRVLPPPTPRASQARPAVQHRRPGPPKGRAPMLDACCGWLAGHLDGRGPVPVADIVAAARNDGLGRGLLYQASGRLGLVRGRKPGDPCGRTTWALPKGTADDNREDTA